VTVDDDGPGIPEDQRADVFRPFLRLDEARNQDYAGSGLGLAIVRDIARSHGGDVVLNPRRWAACAPSPASRPDWPHRHGRAWRAVHDFAITKVSEQLAAVRHRQSTGRSAPPAPGSGKPRVSTSDMNGPIWRGGKLTTAATCRPTSVSACSAW
jgi:signal transduction histidine kinase